MRTSRAPADDLRGCALGMTLDRQIERLRFPDGYRRLFLAAIEAFAEHGFHVASTRDIAARAGMSPAAMYVHFRSKEELLHCIAMAALDLTVEVANEAAAGSTEPVERLRAVVGTLTAWHAHHAPSVRVVLYHLDALTPEHRGEVSDRQRTVNRLVCDIMADGVSRGVFDIPDVAVACGAALSLCVDVARWYQPGRGWSPRELGDQHAALVVRMVLAHQ